MRVAIQRFFQALHYLFPRPQTMRQHIVQNLILGLLVIFVVIGMQESKTVDQSQTDALDWMIGLQKGLPPPDNSNARPFVYYDIDEKSFESWGEPFYTPREKLAILIDAALKQKPEILVIDIELWRSTNEDEPLVNVLQSHSSMVDAPLLVLMPGFRQIESDADSNQAYLIRRASKFDYLTKNNEKIIWASPLFEIDHDGMFRHWKVWQPYCDQNGQPALLPSAQVAVTAQMQGKESMNNLKLALKKYAPLRCNSRTPVLEKPLQLGSITLSNQNKHYTQRILFSIPWKLEPNEVRPVIKWKGKNWSLLTIVPARVITEGSVHPQVPPGHIAVIGSSHQDARDTHNTPLGKMPGSMILINSIYSFIVHGQVQPPSLFFHFFISVALLIVMSIIFARFPSVLGSVISFLFLIIVLMPVSIYFFRYGIWIDFVTPILVVKIFQECMNYIREQHSHLKGTSDDHSLT